MALDSVITIVSVNVGEPAVLLRYDGGEIVSGIDKRPVDTDQLRLSETNLAGDRQSDMRPTPAGDHVHGGPHHAVYAFPSEHYLRIAELIRGDVWPGYMGENLTIRGALESEVCIGDVWAWGSALLQVSAPRGPCFKLGIRMGRQAARTVIRDEVLTGWYLRVLQPGSVPTSGVIDLVSREPSAATVATVQRAVQDRSAVYPELARLPHLSPNLRWLLTQRDRDITGGVPESD